MPADQQDGAGAEDDGTRKIDRVGCFDIELVADPETGKEYKTISRISGTERRSCLDDR